MRRRKRNKQMCRAGPVPAQQALKRCRLLLLQLKPVVFATEPRRVYNTMVCTEAQLPENTAVKSLGVRLGDNSLVSTSDCRHFFFDVKGHAHAWDYHVMQLPAGLDFIVGMDFMGQHDVIYLTKFKKVCIVRSTSH